MDQISIILKVCKSTNLLNKKVIHEDQLLMLIMKIAHSKNLLMVKHLYTTVELVVIA